MIKMAWFKFNKEKNKQKETDYDIPELTEEEIEDMNQDIYDTSFYSELEDIDNEEELDLMTRQETEQEVDNLYNSGMDLEDIERIEYRRSAKLARQTEYRAKVQDRTDFIQAMLTPNMIIGYIVVYIISVLYLWYATGQIAFALIVSLVGSIVIVYWFIYQENKLKLRQAELNELESLARDITMQADIARNTYEVIQKIAEKYNSGRVGNDMNMMYNKLRETGEIDTSRFSLYNFTPIEIFMRNLEIWYSEGADTRTIFTRSVNDITFELLKRDELHKSLKQAMLTESITVILGALFPIIIRLSAGRVYSVLLGLPVAASIMMLLHYIGIIWVAISLKKRAMDIDIR